MNIVMPTATLEIKNTIPVAIRRVAARATLLISVLVLVIAVRTAKFYLFGSPALVDIDAFHIASGLVWTGNLEQAHSFDAFAMLQHQITTSTSFLPWTYPPQFALLFAPLSLLPVSVAYLIFVASSFSLYLYILKRISGDSLGYVILATFPCMAMNISCGQNGFLCAALLGITALGLLAGRSVWAGVALGCLASIKPHLAVAMIFYLLCSRNWISLLAAASVVTITAGLSTIILGADYWMAWLGGLHESGVFLARGLYPLFRMISPYAVLRTLRVPPELCFIAQGVAALCALVLIYKAHHRFSARQAIGVVAAATILVSPYVYDYDGTFLAIGLALLIKELLTAATRRELLALFIFCFGIGLIGTAEHLMWNNAQVQLYQDSGSLFSSSLSIKNLSSNLDGTLSPVCIGGVFGACALVVLLRIINRACAPRSPLISS